MSIAWLVPNNSNNHGGGGGTEFVPGCVLGPYQWSLIYASPHRGGRWVRNVLVVRLLRAPHPWLPCGQLTLLSGPCAPALVLFASWAASTFLDPTWQPVPWIRFPSRRCVLQPRGDHQKVNFVTVNISVDLQGQGLLPKSHRLPFLFWPPLLRGSATTDSCLHTTGRERTESLLQSCFLT